MSVSAFTLRHIGLGFCLVTGLILVIFAHVYYFAETNVQHTVTETSNEFTVTASYLGNEQWEYTVSGSVPNKCIRHDVTHDTTTQDAVAMTLFLYRSDDESLCAKRPDVLVSEGSFTADKNAKVTFSVSEEVQPGSPTGLQPKS